MSTEEHLEPGEDPTENDEFEEVELGAPTLDHNVLLTEFKYRGLIGDKYTEKEEIARGGMGIISKVKDTGLDREVVLKVINPDLVSKADLLTRFIQEARITGQLEHPNIVPVHDIGVLPGDEIYFSMKRIKGRELREVLDEISEADADKSPLSIFALLTIFRKVCDAVAFAHSHRIIHRDIKPDNILVGDFGEVLLVDWGLARRLDEPEIETEDHDLEPDLLSTEISNSSHRTKFGVIKGTPAYMAPEMASGEVDAVDERSDIFLLGATLYAIATLEAPFTNDGPDDIYEILERAEHCHFMPPSERAPERQIPAELERIILKAMALRHEHRYQTVQELSEDIDALMEGRADAQRVSFEKDAYLMREGEKGDTAFVILSGQAAVYKDINGKQTPLVQLGPGSVVGEMALIDDSPRSASVIAVSQVEARLITENSFSQCMGKMPPWFDRTISTLTARLRKMNTDVHPLLRTEPIYHIMNMIRLLYPFAGQPATHPSGSDIIVLHAERTILEISTTLALPAERILECFTRIMRINLVEIVSEDYFHIPNYNLFCQFLEFVRESLDIPTGLPIERTADLFDSGGILTMAFSDSETSIEGDRQYAATPEFELMGCETVEEKAHAFQDMLELILLED